MKPLFRRGPSSTVRVLVLGACALGIGIAAKYTSWFDEIKQRSVDVIAPFYMVADLPAKIEGWAESRTMSRAKLVQENNALRSEVLVLRRKLQREMPGAISSDQHQRQFRRCLGEISILRLLQQ